jgi:ubiquinone/menaquinone biosynthesis C-methylase UbiE
MKIADITTPLRAALIGRTFKGWVRPGDHVLDIGCGNGIVSRKLADQFDVVITGCDTQRYLLREIPFKLMLSKSRLPFRQKKFAIAMFNDVLHHADYITQGKLLIEAFRLTEKVVIFELRPTLVGKNLDYLLNKVHNPNMNIPFTYRSEKEWEMFFRKMHLKYNKRRVASPFWYPFSHVAYMLSQKS